MAHRRFRERLNLDLIFAVPGQTRRCFVRYRIGSWALDPIISRPTTLTFEEGTGILHAFERAESSTFETDEQAAIYQTVARGIMLARSLPKVEIRTTRRPATKRGTISHIGAARLTSGSVRRAHSFAPRRECQVGDGGTRNFPRGLRRGY